MDDQFVLIEEIMDCLSVSKDAVYSCVSTESEPYQRLGYFWTSKRDKVDKWGQLCRADEGEKVVATAGKDQQ
jgi:hypothetical protein